MLKLVEIQYKNKQGSPIIEVIKDSINKTKGGTHA